MVAISVFPTFSVNFFYVFTFSSALPPKSVTKKVWNLIKCMGNFSVLFRSQFFLVCGFLSLVAWIMIKSCYMKEKCGRIDWCPGTRLWVQRWTFRNREEIFGVCLMLIHIFLIFLYFFRGDVKFLMFFYEKGFGRKLLKLFNKHIAKYPETTRKQDHLSKPIKLPAPKKEKRYMAHNKKWDANFSLD